jgi:hypothetical protein
MQGPSGWLIVAGQLIIEGTNEGIFVYNGTPALGNPPIFWVSPGTTDPSGNAIVPTAGVAGMGQFNAGDTILNAKGVFTYSGTPAAGNLISSQSNLTSTDSFGNHYLEGTCSYGTSFACAMIGGALEFFTGSLSGGWTFKAEVLTDSSGDLLLEATGTIYANGTPIG